MSQKIPRTSPGIGYALTEDGDLTRVRVAYVPDEMIRALAVHFAAPVPDPHRPAQPRTTVSVYWFAVAVDPEPVMTDPVILSDPLGVITAEMARDVAQDLGVCIRPLMRRVLDRETGTESRVAIPCGSTRESVCPPCADKARRLRIQQCAEGWHRDTEPEQAGDEDDVEAVDGDEAVPDDGSIAAADADKNGSDVSHGGRRIRSTRRRHDVPDLPRVPMEARTVGRSFTGRNGRTYRPSMFLTLTLPSYGKVRHGVPVDPDSYKYRGAALDAVLFSRLVDRFFVELASI